ncbi:glycosyl-4,4'-diaponeurosporenoate acyltransferase CrtO family protein [Mucilaginibacter ginkgonis]|uniref:Glycosyl-4,4'-diaponeurosporenoate acyltransferase n=1 Tax=Mucilaginibacter ginkgonis TaxID=2682091 RepID=A0A6I4INC3_9SPHI|nr:hypothetical protein [Mucilaginibacter ginkgonis]QQL49270.1 hypothetical protein GO620_013975 [Mucilaginibacter ginkgonis]
MAIAGCPELKTILYLMVADPNDHIDRKVRRIRSWYNALFTVGWSVLCLYPVGMFSWQFLKPTMLYCFIGACIICFFLPGKFIDKLSLSSRASFYKKLKVDWVNALTQNGSVVNRRIKTIRPNYQSVKPGTKAIKRLIAQTYMFEKFHLGLSIYFFLLAVYAGCHGLWFWAVTLLVANIIYNVLPNLLQQYIRLRLTKVADR